MRLFLCVFILLTIGSKLSGQCCSGGSSNPVAGGIGQGALSGKQVELNLNFQYSFSDNFFQGNKSVTDKYFDSYGSLYQYFRVGYGITKSVTMSIETGYYFFRKEIGLDNDPLRTYKSNGFSDVIIFPRFKIYDHFSHKNKVELILGLGYKIPVGSYNDSTRFVEPFSKEVFYVVNPQAVQMTTGAQDIIFLSSFNYGNFKKKFNIFSNAIYIKKGWNPRGEKAGDYFSIALSAGKTLFRDCDLILQLRGEQVLKTTVNKTVFENTFLNYDPDATGHKKIFLSPQLTYSIEKLRFFILVDIPVYQDMIKTQVGSKVQLTSGISYSFPVSGKKQNKAESGNFFCPMHPEIKTSFKTICPLCEMDLEKEE